MPKLQWTFLSRYRFHCSEFWGVYCCCGGFIVSVEFFVVVVVVIVGAWFCLVLVLVVFLTIAMFQ